MSETKRYFTAVFEFTDEAERLQMRTSTPWGVVVGLSVGDVMQEAQISDGALNEIVGSGCSICAGIARKAIDDVNEYVGSQVSDLRVSAIAAGGGKCPKCGSGDGWHMAAKIDPADWIIAQVGGAKAKPIMSLSGGDCLSCGHQEEAVYADEVAS